ncbi:MAG: bifunctional diaminohydroxyphosphoribosylaminopyrimidine deaminase/5-amino-6-(5-phosphoribosylamino)uracil reductase RibD [Rhodospirillaceae bacterium]|nr:bifunctional diaminohydroxyphosphoribosylaminopyrimidine deaminase/5-amino-6-(5-phosphoribosylamino)uracil reductase RibD [Rhodospirillaceae bacterium]
MAIALRLARRALGTAWPNPAVGCVIVAGRGAEARVVGRGWTRPGGRPHAETEALRRAGEAARGATAFVTLEPCSHTGKTPPCTDALKAAGIARVVAAMVDPDNRVSGRGLKALEAAGIAVECGLGGAEAAEINAGYILHRTLGRPLVTLKLATTLDGRIATHRGESRWITGDSARAAAHLLRARHDAIMVGIGTAAEDDPMLDCRLPGLEGRSPLRVVLDGHLRLPLTNRMVATAKDQATWVITREGGDEGRKDLLAEAGVEIVEVPADHEDRPPLSAILALLAEAGVTRLLVEGGSHLTAAFLAEDLVDRIEWFRAPMLMGGDGVPAVQPFGVDRLSEAPRYTRTNIRFPGPDLLESLRRGD